ncbi:MAG: hypothetical protein ACLPQY_20635 [Streptosporangiaceae bacterium]
MADLHFRRHDVDELARKLGQADLTAGERELLLAIFSAAALRTETAEPGSEQTLADAELRRQRAEREPTLADLRAGLIDAFIPDVPGEVELIVFKIHG